ncbi:MAG: DUF523 domain-containing protein [Ghiorsea sp.]
MVLSPKILISACLVGEAVRYDGGDCLGYLDAQAKAYIQRWQEHGLLLPFCPEVAGGLDVPRMAAEIKGNRVLTATGQDVSSAFQSGAQQALDLCLQHHIRIAILKQGSPSCGNSRINDGTFSKTKIAGQGITAKLLQQHGIRVLNEAELSGLTENDVGSLGSFEGLTT